MYFNAGVYQGWAESWGFRDFFFGPFGIPSFTNQEEMSEWFEAMGVVLPDTMPNPNSFLHTQTFLKEAKTLRQRAFARLFNGFTKDSEITLNLTELKKHPIKPFNNTCRSLMAACYRDKVARKALSKMRFAQGPYSTGGDPELVIALQDLADIVAWEAKQAFVSDYFPAPMDVDPLTDDHVDLVMLSMQREIDREAQRTHKQPPIYASLPRERQVALAERRRYWFGVYGITPKNWGKGAWSLWRVKNIPYPEGFPKADY